jgi:uncharacterized protein
MIDRRNFLKIGAGTALGSALPSSQAATPGIRQLRRLGRTELKVSDISFGSASSSDPDLVRHAFERGVNFFDSAESYRGGDAEEAIAKALKGKRDKVILTSKTKAGAGDTRAEIMKSLEGSLKRLGTDHVDIYFNHAVNDVDRLRNPEWREFTELAKRQGKIRFRGVSGHGGHLAQCLDYAIDQNLADVILVAYNFSQDPGIADRLRHTFHWAAIQPELPRVLAKAKARDIGIIAMKTLMGARLNDMRRFESAGTTFSQAALRWTLADPNVDALVISMTDKNQIDEFLGASGATRTSAYDRELLTRYAMLQAGHYCQPGCNACEASCPAGVQISEVLRTRMYAVDYRDEILARSEYAQLDRDATACLSCANQKCLGACPVNVPIAQLTREAGSSLA